MCISLTKLDSYLQDVSLKEIFTSQCVWILKREKQRVSMAPGIHLDRRVYMNLILASAVPVVRAAAKRQCPMPS